MSDLEIDPAVGRLVTAWLDKHDRHPGSKQVATEVRDFTPRPARLGLGAKYVPHRPNMSEAHRRLSGSLRKQRREQELQKPEAVDRTDDVDSRAAVVVHKRRGPGRPLKNPPSERPNPVTVKPGQSVGLGQTLDNEDDFGRPQNGHLMGNGTGHHGNGVGNNASNGASHKKKKIRSRQKNLKRDNRPRDQLPSHLSEETLHGGRVYKEDVPNGGAT